MKPGLQIQIPTPCHENWDKMNPTGQGRFCLSCQKEVIDFSLMTDKEILNYISSASSTMCGRFGNDQLNRELVRAREPRKLWWRQWMGIAASFILLTAKSNAQVKAPKDTIVCLPATSSNEEIIVGKMGGITSIDNDHYQRNYIVNGIVKDDNGMPVPYATVIIKGTKRGVATNANGGFIIKIEDAKYPVLQISSVGYEAQEIKVENRDAANPTVNVTLRLQLATTMGLTGDVVVIGRRKRKPLANLFRSNPVKLVKQQPESVLKVYPNPIAAGTDAKIEINELVNGKYLLNIYDINGNLIVFKEIHVASNRLNENFRFDQRFNSGIYVVKVEGNGKSLASKIVVH